MHFIYVGVLVAIGIANEKCAREESTLIVLDLSVSLNRNLCFNLGEHDEIRSYEGVAVSISIIESLHTVAIRSKSGRFWFYKLSPSSTLTFIWIPYLVILCSFEFTKHHNTMKREAVVGDRCHELWDSSNQIHIIESIPLHFQIPANKLFVYGIFRNVYIYTCIWISTSVYMNVCVWRLMTLPQKRDWRLWLPLGTPTEEMRQRRQWWPLLWGERYLWAKGKGRDSSQADHGLNTSASFEMRVSIFIFGEIRLRATSKYEGEQFVC